MIAEEADESDENDSDEESEEESDEDEESDPDSKKSEPEEADHETETELSAPEPEIKKVVKSSTEDGTTTTSGESSSTTHDSEGVVVRKESIGGSRSSVMGNEAITVTVSEFKAGKNASFLKNKKIEKLFVEYRYFFFFGTVENNCDYFMQWTVTYIWIFVLMILLFFCGNYFRELLIGSIYENNYRSWPFSMWTCCPVPLQCIPSCFKQG